MIRYVPPSETLSEFYLPKVSKATFNTGYSIIHFILGTVTNWWYSIFSYHQTNSLQSHHKRGWSWHYGSKGQVRHRWIGEKRERKVFLQTHVWVLCGHNETRHATCEMIFEQAVGNFMQVSRRMTTTSKFVNGHAALICLRKNIVAPIWPICILSCSSFNAKG